MSERNKQLKLAKTVIGKCEYKSHVYDVLYGGIFDLNQTGGQIVNLDKDEYSSMLTDFLLSDKGSEYLIPSQTQTVADRDLLTRPEEVKKLLKPYRENKQEEDLLNSLSNLKLNVADEDIDLVKSTEKQRQIVNVFPEDNNTYNNLRKWGKALLTLSIVCSLLIIGGFTALGVITNNLPINIATGVTIALVTTIGLRTTGSVLIAEANTEKNSLDCVRSKVSKYV